ncbi:MAG TPA: hypothetical protein VMU43_12305 [Candidatus Acidoferrum sp.]|nr:hypothetical protein [Candidatus Acidoferrum sp.]
MILEAARNLRKEKFTLVEIEQIRYQLLARLGEKGKTTADYVASVLEESGFRLALVAATGDEEALEEEFHDLLHFSNLEDAEMCLIHLDELYRKFMAAKNTHAAGRVLEVARLGRRRAEMIAHNRKVDATKRAEKAEIARWFAIWLETPDAFFDWLDVRKQSPEFQAQFPLSGME